MLTFPETPLPVVIEMYTGSWVDITDYVYVRDGITIRRGQADEASSPEPSSCDLTLNNRDGRFSPRNPMSPLYGLIGRNTPVRIRIGDGLAGDGFFRINLASITSRAFSLDNAALDITGDIDIRSDAAMDAWETGAVLATKYLVSGGNRSWAFLIDASGYLTFAWSPDGTSGAIITATSTAPAPVTNAQRQALRVTLDVNNGSGGWTATFYTADTIDGLWVQLGSAVTTAGTTSIFSGAGNLHVGNSTEFSSFAQTGKLYGFELRNGINGTEVANPDFTSLEPSVAPSFTDDAGRTWLLDDGYTADPSIRFTGEVSEWPSRWDVSGQDVYVPVTAQGILRRLGQGNQPLRSPLKSAMLLAGGVDQGFLTAYWPLEDGQAAGKVTSFASALPGRPSMRSSGTAPDVGSELGIGPLLGSDRIPVLAASTTLSGAVPAATDGAIVAVSIMDVPITTGWADNTPILWVQQSEAGSSVAFWEVRYKSGSGGDLQVRALDADGSQLAASGTLNFDIDGKQLWLGFIVQQSGSDTLWTLYTRTIGDDGITVNEVGVYSQTFSGRSTTHATRVRIAPAGGLTELAIGHVAMSYVASFGNYYSTDGLQLGIISYAGETAANRAHRLVAELGASFLAIGASNIAAAGDNSTVGMGPQETPTSFSDAFNETWPADQALAYETRDTLGLSWRSRHSLYNQPVALTLDYEGAGEVAPDLEPTDDDRYVRNDVEVKRKNGSSERATDSTSRMGTQDPPNGVGRYETSVELNLHGDEILADVANWLLHLGTWDEARYPTVRINLAALARHGKWDLIADAAGLDVGDRLRLTNLPSWLPPGPVDLMALGFEERIYPFAWDITTNNPPYGPWQVAEYGSATDPNGAGTDRYDTAGCVTKAGLWLPGSANSYASTPDTAALSDTNDMDLRWDGALVNWASGSAQVLIGKWLITGNQRSYRLFVSATGFLQFGWSADGTAVLTRTSTLPIPALNGERIALRATIDVVDGGNHVVTFYYRSSGVDSSTWNQLGNAVTTAGTTAIFDSTALYTVGALDGGVDLATGVCYAALMLNSIDGSSVSDVDFTESATGTTSVIDVSNAGSRTWTVNGSAHIYGPFTAGTDTSMLVQTTLGQPWTTDSDDLPMDLAAAGAVLSITAVSPADSMVQLLTVSTTVSNGVTKVIQPGEPISVAQAGIYAL